jgi:hypothetical protein
MSWPIFTALTRRLVCSRGHHHGSNFCANCGKQLRLEPFFTFQVESIDGRLGQVVHAVNSHHAKYQFRTTYAASELHTRRLP